MKGKKNAELTEFRKNELDAMDKFQKEIDQYGLKVDRSSSGGSYSDTCMEFFNLSIVTEKMPVKGNKALIKRLEEDGRYWVQKWLNTIPGTPRQYVFRVCKVVTIATGRADLVGNDLVELERKLYDGAAVCVDDLTERQIDHIRGHFGALVHHQIKGGRAYMALDKEALK